MSESQSSSEPIKLPSFQDTFVLDSVDYSFAHALLSLKNSAPLFQQKPIPSPCDDSITDSDRPVDSASENSTPMSKLPSISTIVASTSKMKKSRLNDSSSPPLGVSTSAVSASSEDNFNPVPSLTILSNILTSTGKIRPDHSHPNEEELPRKPSRGKYKCGRCGKPKENHVCTMVDECVLTYSLGIQTGPCTLAHYEKTVAVRRPEIVFPATTMAPPRPLSLAISTSFL